LPAPPAAHEIGPSSSSYHASRQPRDPAATHGGPPPSHVAAIGNRHHRVAILVNRSALSRPPRRPIARMLEQFGSDRGARPDRTARRHRISGPSQESAALTRSICLLGPPDNRPARRLASGRKEQSRKAFEHRALDLARIKVRRAASAPSRMFLGHGPTARTPGAFGHQDQPRRAATRCAGGRHQRLSGQSPDAAEKKTEGRTEARLFRTSSRSICRTPLVRSTATGLAAAPRLSVRIAVEHGNEAIAAAELA